MAVLTETQLDDAENIIENMKYRANDDMDGWYPTFEEVKEYVTKKSRSDIMFLLWLTNPENKLSPEQNEVRKKILKMLYDSSILTIKAD